MNHKETSLFISKTKVKAPSGRFPEGAFTFVSSQPF